MTKCSQTYMITTIYLRVQYVNIYIYIYICITKIANQLDYGDFRQIILYFGRSIIMNSN